jgi:hypothetical protein
MGVVMPPWVYQPLLLFTLLTLTGFILSAVRSLTSTHPPNEQLPPTDHRPLPTVYRPLVTDPRHLPTKLPLFILAGTFLLSLSLYLTYNLTFVQHQGRYLFPALIPIALAVALSWTTLLQPITRRWPPAVYLLPAGLALALFALDLLALFRFIIPEFKQ